MRTFTEAFGECVPHVEGREPTAADHKKMDAQAEEAIARMADIAEEIESHPFALGYLAGLYNTSCCERHALLNVFTNGVKIGMEMERSETGGIKP